jgi:integrase
MPRKPKPRRRRVKGTGSIFLDKRRGGWQAKLPAGRKPNGKLRYRWFSGATAEDVQRQMDDCSPPRAAVTLAAWWERWHKSLTCRQQSRDNYARYYKLRIGPSLGHIPVASITAFAIQEAWNQWGRGEGGVGATTIRVTLDALSACLQGALRAGVIAQNPARNAVRPSAAEQQFDLFEKEELLLIIEACLQDRKLYPFAVCASVGCRIGEALAWQPGDADPISGRLSISRTANRGGKLGPPKSRNGKRVVTVPTVARKALSLPPDTPHYCTALKRWVRLLEELGLRYRAPHQLRHSVATYSLAAGAELGNVARDLGDSVGVIVRTYLHATSGKGVSEAMEGVLTGNIGLPKGGAKATKPRKSKPISV